MTMLASDVISRARDVLHDTDGIRWLDAEMLRWVADGQREAVALNPSLYTKTIVFTLVAGVTQSLAAVTDFVGLVAVSKNVAADGVTPGRVVTMIDERLMEALDPLWQAAAPASTVIHAMYDPARRYQFRVQPPAVAGGKVEVIYGATPPEVVSVTDTLALRDNCLPMLVDYVVFRAISKDSEVADELARAKIHHDRFVAQAPKL